MIINFNKIDEKIIEKMRGGENFARINRFDDESKMIAKITLEPSSSIGYHSHINDEEVIYVIKGKGLCLDGDERFDISEGLVNYIPRGKSHSIINNSDENLVLFAVILK